MGTMCNEIMLDYGNAWSVVILGSCNSSQGIVVSAYLIMVAVIGLMIADLRTMSIVVWIIVAVMHGGHQSEDYSGSPDDHDNSPEDHDYSVGIIVVVMVNVSSDDHINSLDDHVYCLGIVVVFKEMISSEDHINSPDDHDYCLGIIVVFKEMISSEDHGKSLKDHDYSV